MTKTKKPATPQVGDVWIKNPYRTVPYPRGRVIITDTIPPGNQNPTRVNYHYIVGPSAGKPRTLEIRDFLGNFTHGSSATDAGQAAQGSLPMTTPVYTGEEGQEL